MFEQNTRGYVDMMERTIRGLATRKAESRRNSRAESNHKLDVYEDALHKNLEYGILLKSNFDKLMRAVTETRAAMA